MRSCCRIIAAAALLAGCGGSAAYVSEPNAPAPEEPATSAPEPHAGDRHADAEHAHQFPPEVDAFHDVLAPLWHAEPGTDRTDNTCAALDDLADRADAIATARARGAVPELDTDAQVSWQQAAEQLVASVEELETACEQPGRPEFETALAAIHDHFHALIAPLGHDR